MINDNSTNVQSITTVKLAPTSPDSHWKSYYFHQQQTSLILLQSLFQFKILRWFLFHNNIFNSSRIGRSLRRCKGSRKFWQPRITSRFPLNCRRLKNKHWKFMSQKKPRPNPLHANSAESSCGQINPRQYTSCASRQAQTAALQPGKLRLVSV